MKLKALKIIDSSDYNISKLQSGLKEYTEQLSPNTFLSGVFMDVTVNTTDTKIAHGLAAMPNGWIITDKLSQGDIWRVSWDSKFITLKASVATSAKVWVF